MPQLPSWAPGAGPFSKNENKNKKQKGGIVAQCSQIQNSSLLLLLPLIKAYNVPKPVPYILCI